MTTSLLFRLGWLIGTVCVDVIGSLMRVIGGCYRQSGKLHAETVGMAAEQTKRTLNWRRQAKPIAPGSDGVGVADFGFNVYDVPQAFTPYYLSYLRIEAECRRSPHTTRQAMPS
jgi:hypothetical protein